MAAATVDEGMGFGMTSRTRLWVLAVSTPVIVFALLGGYLGQAMAKDDTYQPLRIFEDVVSLVVNNYVEEVDVRKAMGGALHGLADGLDPDSAFLTADLVKTYDSTASAGTAEVGQISRTARPSLQPLTGLPGSLTAVQGSARGG